jgi:hypothetical protein
VRNERVPVSYDFFGLLPRQFQDLANDLVGRDLGLRFEVFTDGRDGGIDGRSVTADGNVILQAKHHARSGFQKLRAEMKRERDAIDALQPIRYVFVTSARLTPLNKAELMSIIGPTLRASADIYSPDDLNALLRRFPAIEMSHPALWGQSAAVQQELITSAVAGALSASSERRSPAEDGGSRAMILYELWVRAYCPGQSQKALWRVFHRDYNVLIPQTYIDRSLATLEILREYDAWQGQTGELEQPFREFTRVAADLVVLITASDPATNDRKYQEQFLSLRSHGLFFYVVPVDALDSAVERGNWIETEKNVMRRVLFEMIVASNGIIEAVNRMQLFRPLEPFVNPDFDAPPLPSRPYPGLDFIRGEAHAGGV